MTADASRPTVVALIDRVASSSPERLAVHASDGTLTYADLVARAGALAGELRGAGLATDDLVGVCVERSASLVVGGARGDDGRGRLRRHRPQVPRRAGLVDARGLGRSCDGL